MGMVNLKCPSCGADITISDKKDFGFCEYCGTKVMQDKIVVEHRVDESGKYDNFHSLAIDAYNGKNYEEAYNYFTKALEINHDDIMVVFRRSICAGKLVSGGKKFSEASSGIEKAFCAADDEQKKTIISEIYKLITEASFSAESVFPDVNACKEYVYGLSEHIKLGKELFKYIENEGRETITDYCNAVLSQCKLVGSSYKYDGGTKSRTIIRSTTDNKKNEIKINDFIKVSLGSSAPQKQKEEIIEEDNIKEYRTPDEVISNVSSAASFFKSQLNRFVGNDISVLKESLSSIKSDIKALPTLSRVLHAVFSVPMCIIAVILLLINPVIGFIVIGIEIICFIVYKKTDNDGKAGSLYKELVETSLSLSENTKKSKELSK